MDIRFENSSKAQSSLADELAGKGFLCPVSSQRFRQRLSELSSAPCLSDLHDHRPANIVLLQAKHPYLFSTDLGEGFALRFLPDHDPLAMNGDSTPDWNRITALKLHSLAANHE